MDFMTLRRVCHSTSIVAEMPLLTLSFQAELDAAQVEKLMKEEMIAFYKQVLDPSSSSRARVSVHLHAQGASELDQKMVELLQGLDLNDVPPETRRSVNLLESYLKTDVKMADVKVAEVMEKAENAGLTRALQESESRETVVLNADAVQSAAEITDVDQFKAGLKAVDGGRPPKPPSRYCEK
jgi:insulysin